MPLNKSCSIDALRDNIAAEIQSGTPRDQAVAIAYSTLRRACADENKPVPSSKDAANVTREFKRKKGERSSDYLEAALEEAKRSLSHRNFSMLHQLARSRAGGRAAARTRMTSVEKALVLGPEALTEYEMADALFRLGMIEAAEARKNLELGGAAVAKWLGIEAGRRALSKAANDSKKTAGAQHAVSKGFQSGDADGGAHAHGLARSAGKTRKDGAHTHWYKMPGTGLLFRTETDGEHEHAISDDPGKTAKNGAHSHKVYMPGTGTMVETTIDGTHAHELMLETSGLGAQHTHTVKTPDGTVLTSLTVAEALASGEVLLTDSPELPPASVILSAMNRAANLEIHLEHARMAAAAQLARAAEERAVSPSSPAILVSMSDGSAEVETSDDNRFRVACSIDAEPGDIVEIGADMSGEPFVEMHSAASAPASSEALMKSIEAAYDRKLHCTKVEFSGPEDARVVFVAGAPNELELARGEALVGPDGAAFAEAYLAPLRLTKSQVVVGFAHPTLPRESLAGKAATLKDDTERLKKELSRWPGAKIIALGKVAKEALDQLGDCAEMTLPHPTALRSGGERFTEQAFRKIKALAKSLDTAPAGGEDVSHRTTGPRTGQEPGTLAGAIGELRAAGQIQVRISKAADEKQIVYGVVLDPYMVDTQGEWVPPAEIESTAHGFVKKSRVIGVEHKRKANASLVESYVVPYPTTKDYQAALSNLPHQSYEMPYGGDTVHSGAWIAGVELGDAEWADYRAGKITGFSIGGFSFKTKVPLAAMPAVEFVKLAPVL